MRMKKKCPVRGWGKSPLSPGEIFYEIYRKKNHPRESDEKKSTPIKDEQNPPTTKLPTPSLEI